MTYMVPAQQMLMTALKSWQEPIWIPKDRLYKQSMSRGSGSRMTWMMSHQRIGSHPVSKGDFDSRKLLSPNLVGL